MKCRYCPQGFLTEADRYEHEKTHQKSGTGEFVKCYTCALQKGCNLYATYTAKTGPEKASYKANVIDPCGLYVPKER